jgi:hypothetical protein
LANEYYVFALKEAFERMPPDRPEYTKRRAGMVIVRAFKDEYFNFADPILACFVKNVVLGTFNIEFEDIYVGDAELIDQGGNRNGLHVIVAGSPGHFFNSK